jgi:integrase
MKAKFFREKKEVTRNKRELGAYTLAQIQPFLVSKYVRKRLEAVKPVTARRELSILSHALNSAEKYFGIYLPHGNPVSRMSLPKNPRGRERRISPAEETAILEALAYNPAMRCLVTFAIETGMRRGELVNMRWDHINWKAQMLRPALCQGKRSDLSGVRRREASRTDRGGLRSSTGAG